MSYDLTNPETGLPATYVPLEGAEFEALLPRVLPPHWHRRREDPRELASRAVYETVNTRVIVSAGTEEDGKRWLHLSVSKRDGRMPRWDELLEVRDVVAGAEALAIHVCPPRSEHFDVFMNGVLRDRPARERVEIMHLWVPLEGSPLPNFLRARGGSL